MKLKSCISLLAALQLGTVLAGGLLDPTTLSSTVTTVLVGGEEIDVEGLASPYLTQTPGATLVKDSSGWRLVLSGATISGAGIQADGNFTIELAANTQNAIYITDYSNEVGAGGALGSASYGINVTHDLTICGSGSLYVNNIAARGGLLECDPEGIRIGRNGWYSGNLTITGGASVSVACLNGPGVRMDNGGDISVNLASLAVSSPDTAVYTSSSFSSKAAILSLLSSGGSALSASESVSMWYTYGSFVSRSGFCVATNGGLSMDQCVCSALGSEKPCFFGSGCYFGEGLYKIATDGASENTSAIYANGRLEIDGAEIKYCTPSAHGIYIKEKSSSDNVAYVKAGLIELEDSVNVDEMFAFNAIAANAYSIVSSLGNYLNPESLYADTLGSFILDYIASMSFDLKSGYAQYGIQSKNVKLQMTGGTILAPNALKYGISCKEVEISGGSFSGTSETTPTYGGKELKCVTEAVVGGISSAKITSGWTTKLPSYYGTGSLYLDAAVQLYFWLEGDGSETAQDDGEGTENTTEGNGEEDGGKKDVSVTDSDSSQVASTKPVTAYSATKAQVLHGSVYNGSTLVGVIDLKIGKANKKTGAATVSGTITARGGEKIKLVSTKVKLSTSAVSQFDVTLKNYGTMTLKLGAEGFSATTTRGWVIGSAEIGSTVTGNMVFTLDTFPTWISDSSWKVLQDYLPTSQGFESNKGKWKFPKGASISMKKGVIKVSKGGAGNLSALKITNNAKSGTFKGSFKIYTTNGTKLRKYSATVTGVVADGVYSAWITIKKVNGTFTGDIAVQ